LLQPIEKLARNDIVAAPAFENALALGFSSFFTRLPGAMPAFLSASPSAKIPTFLISAQP